MNANHDPRWIEAQLRYIRERDEMGNQPYMHNKNCKNCGVDLLEVHYGLKYCGDCRTIPLKERDGFYARQG